MITALITFDCKNVSTTSIRELNLKRKTEIVLSIDLKKHDNVGLHTYLYYSSSR